MSRERKTDKTDQAFPAVGWVVRLDESRVLFVTN